MFSQKSIENHKSHYKIFVQLNFSDIDIFDTNNPP